MSKLDEIIETNYFCIDDGGDKVYYKGFVKLIALEFAKHILEEAAENATIETEEIYAGSLGNENGHLYNKVQIVNKQSITDTLNKYFYGINNQ